MELINVILNFPTEYYIQIKETQFFLTLKIDSRPNQPKNTSFFNIF